MQTRRASHGTLHNTLTTQYVFLQLNNTKKKQNPKSKMAKKEKEKIEPKRYVPMRRKRNNGTIILNK